MKIHEVFAKIDRGEYLFGRVMSIVRIVAYASMILTGLKLLFGIDMPYGIIMAVLVVCYIPTMLVLGHADLKKLKIWEKQNEYVTGEVNPYFKNLKTSVENIEKTVNVKV